jgi:phosphatidylserine decarboxylase
MRSALSVWAQFVLPQRILAALVFRLSRCTWPVIKSPLIQWFANHYQIDLAEAEQPNLDAYPSFNDFFTRALQKNARPLSGDEQTLVSPADGYLTEFGSAAAGRLLQAKGMEYRLDELLGEPQAGAVDLVLGTFVTIYLAPHNYHRVHMPLAGTLKRTRYVPGKRFSVNRHTASRIPRLFCRNERVVCWFDTAVGPMALVLVGALNVSSISTRWLGEIPSGRPKVWQDAEPPQRRYGRGDEIGHFNLGSTVIVLLPPAAISWNEGLKTEGPLRLGQSLGRIRAAAGNT